MRLSIIKLPSPSGQQIRYNSLRIHPNGVWALLTTPKIKLFNRVEISQTVLRTVFFSLISIVVLIAFIKSWSKANTPSRLGDYTRTAILRWKPQIEDLGRGVNIYEVHNYPNPPIMALILKLFVSFSPSATFAIWFLFKLGLAVVMAFWAIRLVSNGKPLNDMIIGLAVLLSMHPIIGDLSHGNVNIVIAAMVFGCLELYRRGFDFSAGLMLALAIACKVTPALFVPYFIWKRAWKLVLGSILGMLLWVVVVPGAILGFDFNKQLVTSWFTTMVKPFVIDGKVTSEHPNQSIPGVVFRLLTSEPSFLTYGEDGNGPPEAAEFHTIFDIGTIQAKRLTKLITIGFGLLILWLCRTRERAGLIFAAECALIFLGMLLLSERTWKHHSVTLILPMLVLLSAAILHRSRICLICAITSSSLMLFQSALSEDWQNLALVYGVYTIAYVILTLGICQFLRVSLKQTVVKTTNITNFNGSPGLLA